VEKKILEKISKEFTGSAKLEENTSFQTSLRASIISQKINFNLFSIKYARAKFQHSFHNENVSIAQILDIREARFSTLTGSTVHLELDLQQSSSMYDTACNIGLICRNAFKEGKIRLLIKSYYFMR